MAGEASELRRREVPSPSNVGGPGWEDMVAIRHRGLVDDAADEEPSRPGVGILDAGACDKRARPSRYSEHDDHQGWPIHILDWGELRQRIGMVVLQRLRRTWVVPGPRLRRSTAGANADRLVEQAQFRGAHRGLDLGGARAHRLQHRGCWRGAAKKYVSSPNCHYKNTPGAAKSVWNVHEDDCRVSAIVVDTSFFK